MEDTADSTLKELVRSWHRQAAKYPARGLVLPNCDVGSRRKAPWTARSGTDLIQQAAESPAWGW